MQTTLSIRDNFRDKTILLIGATGFVGKVLLALLLEQVQTARCIYLLIRTEADQSAYERLKKDIFASPVFTNHLKSVSIDNLLEQRLKPIIGDVTKPLLNLNGEILTEVLNTVDLVINSAGLIDFFPDVERSFQVNTLGAMHAAELVRQSDHAKLIYISTCYIFGKEVAPIQELPYHPVARDGTLWDAPTEVNWLRSAIEDIKQHIMGRYKQRKMLVKLGEERAIFWGLSNTYCYTKALADSMLYHSYKDIASAIIRPSIIESALSYPMPGWKEGFNTSSPLCLLMSSWYPYLVAKKDLILDLIPVDVMCRSVLLIASALIANQAAPIYHLSTSARNPCYLKNLIQDARSWYKKNPLTTSHRMIHYMRTLMNAYIISPTCCIAPGPLSQRLQLINTTLSYVPMIGCHLQRPIQSLLKIVKHILSLNKLYKPFMYDHQYIFAAHAIECLHAQEDIFQDEIKHLNWQKYVMEIHMPGVHKWVFVTKHANVAHV